MKQILFVSRHNEHAVLFVPTPSHQSMLISQGPSETRALTSDFGGIMPSVGDDVAGLLLTRHVLYI